ncbi:MAG: alginate lyase family protein [Candidatus Didemnitutus sp.]|nr:alginate lyase family protein [Candidatus Didemnitutus sp.]
MKLLRYALALAAPLLAVAQTAKPFLVDAEPRTAAQLDAEIKKALATPIRTVVDKPKPSPTGDAHDYVSYARYYWPDPSKPDGLPYVQRDGHHNREQVDAGDRGRLGKFCDIVPVLALGWAKDRREDCARRAGEWIRAWLLAPETRMKPALDYAQVRLGRDHNRGSSSGVLDGRGLAWVADALAVLHGSPALTAVEERAVRAWFEEYYRWLETAPTAKKEHAATNNHGTWFLVQAAGIALYLGREDDARRFCEEDKARIAAQIKPDGSQPDELRRQDALGYSRFNLDAQLLVARIGQRVGVDLWNYEAPGSGSLKKAVAYLAPYNADPTKWPGRQLEKLPPGFLDAILAQAAAFEKP